MINRLRQKVIQFTESKKETPVIAAISAGLYPLLYCYDRNFTLVNSWGQLCFYVFLYLIFPIVIFLGLNYISSKITLLDKYRKYLIPVLNFTFFTLLVALSTYGVHNKRMSALALIIAFVLAVLLSKHLKKIIVVQLLLAGFVFFKLIPHVYKSVTYKNNWIQSTDNISAVVFKQKPNVYFIQPDGYANYIELKKGHYNYDNSAFESYLKENDFINYPNYRSNYFSTLSSNSALFGMKHHYYDEPKINDSELYNARSIIVGDNPVIDIFKNNNYKTNLLLHSAYLLVSRPDLKFDYCNIDKSEISYLARGFEVSKNLTDDLRNAIENNKGQSNFYFIEKFVPGHIAGRANDALGKDVEREIYLDKLDQANTWLKEVIDLIESQDKNALIVLAADHGGFVGLNYSFESRVKLTDPDAVKSIFTSMLAIKWPGKAPKFDSQFKTSVNFFRILFAHLSDDERYLKNLQDDKSFTIINSGAPFGVYEVINESGAVIFNKFAE